MTMSNGCATNAIGGIALVHYRGNLQHQLISHGRSIARNVRANANVSLQLQLKLLCFAQYSSGALCLLANAVCDLDRGSNWRLP